jgi:hypothetical protein
MTSPNPRSVFSAVCRSNGIVLGRARATVGPMNFFDYRRAPASHYQSAAITPSMVGGSWGRTVERGGPSQALRFVPVFSSDAGQRRLICKLRGVIKALRSLLRFPLVPVSPKTTSGIFQRLFFAPVLSSVPVLHADNKAWSRTHEAQRNRASGAKRYE